MSAAVPAERRVVLETPTQWRTFRAVNLNRARLVFDHVLHRPPKSRHIEGEFRESARRLLHLDPPRFDPLWSEAVESHLESRIADQLQRSFPRGPPIPLIAAPEGDWLDVLRFLYVLVRVRQPDQIIETGVGPVGSSTSFFLGALRANQRGHLWSIDSGYYISEHGVEPGSGIPDELRDRHTLVIAAARGQLTRLLAQCAPIGLFLHDSEHTYANMSFEFETAWPRLASGGYLLCDDAHNSSPDRFGSRVGVPPVFLSYGGSPFGVMEKP